MSNNVVRIEGHAGLRKAQFVQLLRAQRGLSLSDAGKIAEKVLAAKPIDIAFRSTRDAQAFTVKACKLGARAVTGGI